MTRSGSGSVFPLRVPMEARGKRKKQIRLSKRRAIRAGTAGSFPEIVFDPGDGGTLSITTSSASDLRLDEQAQIESLRNLTPRYLLHTFDMRSCDHLHFGGIVDDLPNDFVDQYLYDVEQCARHMCSVVSEEKSPVAEHS